MQAFSSQAHRQPPNKQFEPTVTRRRGRGACAPFHYAHAARWTRCRAAAQLRRYATRTAVLVSLVVLSLFPSLGAAFGVGCGIYVREQSDAAKQLFFAKPDDTMVLMLLNGEVTSLAVVAEESEGELRELGDVMRRVYVQEGTRVEARFTVTRVCGPDARECDGIGISASFVVRTGGSVQTLEGNGGSGC